ncbi:anaerobic ribonucleoside-triphosphate reductase activating protein [Serinibacter arcticus]|uniref:Anaerobic ribonucleoside-triphosphate reductase activating protein n=1 Tax=Serinibacter arcticus TaxID=1655435 RepID=A0A2U1ZT68_9MICO|nr:anaerobic ribonucleoside-triphosphate reductase activating protein [Serinibacter arcticus]PWD50177.1 anaerobic ribonucleoside-triphosphate reductase activating protein [Serinibacter arcticus]
MRAGAGPAAGDLRIAGLVPLSTVDWPDRLVATVFLQGCPWRCRYCHNPDLLPSRTLGTVSWGEVAALLDRRHGLLDGVVFTGGEPTRQPALVAAVSRVREAGFAVGLHTAGAYPGRLAAVLDELDWVGLDVKALPGDYAELVGTARAGERAWRSLGLVLDAAGRGLGHEVRTTVAPGMADRTLALARELRRLGVRSYALQQARAEGTLALADAHPPGWDEEFAALAAEVTGLGFPSLVVR